MLTESGNHATETSAILKADVFSYDSIDNRVADKQNVQLKLTVDYASTFFRVWCVLFSIGFLSLSVLILRSVDSLYMETTGGTLNLREDSHIRLKFANWYLTNQGNSLMLRSDLHLHSSTFSVDIATPRCFQLHLMDNSYLSIDENGITTTLNKARACYFTFESLSEFGNRLKLCGRNAWVALDSGAPQQLRLISRDMTPQLMNQWSSLFLYDYLSNKNLPKYDEEAWNSSTAMVVERVHPVRGVNLGGWFIPEVWMLPSFFNGSGFGWGGSLCKMMNFSRALTEERMLRHLSTWVMEGDIRRMAEIGLDSIRLPLGYWNVIEDPYRMYAPSNVSVSLQYIDWLFDTAARYGISILLDLHGAPGSQNGIDHSGCSMTPMWHLEANQQLSLLAIDTLMERYHDRANLYGIELLNEPSRYYSVNNHTLLVNFYKQAYERVRRWHKSCNVVINEIYEECYDKWLGEFEEPLYYNLLLDLHLYNWQLPYTYESREEHVDNARGWAALIQRYNQHLPVMVGEWCMSTGTYVQAGQPFVDAAIMSFRHSFGSYVWTWRIEEGIHFDEWDVQLQYQHEQGLRMHYEE